MDSKPLEGLKSEGRQQEATGFVVEVPWRYSCQNRHEDCLQFPGGPGCVATVCVYYKYKGVGIKVHLFTDCSCILKSLFLI